MSQIAPYSLYSVLRLTHMALDKVMHYVGNGVSFGTNLYSSLVLLGVKGLLPYNISVLNNILIVVLRPSSDAFVTIRTDT